jgi:A/G-specific adenine glycosylase
MPPRKRAPPKPSAKPARTKSPAPPLSIHAPPASPISTPALPPARRHVAAYHYAQLLQDRAACAALLAWFGGDVSTARSMPWRKTWVDPAEYAGREAQLRDVLMRRAYEVWVSEVSKFFSSSLGCCSSCVWARTRSGRGVTWRDVDGKADCDEKCFSRRVSRR